MTTTPTRVATTVPAAEDSRTMCSDRGRHACTPRRKTAGSSSPSRRDGVVERLETRTGQITDSGPTAANPNGTGHQPPIPKLTIVIGGNGAGKTT